MHTMHSPQLCTYFHWRTHVTKRTGKSVFIVRSLGIFRHFQNFPGNSLFSGKIRWETRFCRRQARMSNHSRVKQQFLVKIVPRASKNHAMTNSDWTNVHAFIHICSAFAPNILWHSLIYLLPGELQADMTERICSHLLQPLLLVDARVCLCWPNTFVKCIRGLNLLSLLVCSELLRSVTSHELKLMTVVFGWPWYMSHKFQNIKIG